MKRQLLLATAEVIGFHFIGHGDFEELFLVSGEGMKKCVLAPRLKHMLDSALSIEDCILSACSTKDFGRQILGRNVKYVVCWRGNVEDDVANEFSRDAF